MDLPGNVGLTDTDEVLRGVGDLAAVLLLADEQVLLDAVVGLVQAPVPEVDIREAQVDDELADNQQSNKGGAQGDGNV